MIVDSIKVRFLSAIVTVAALFMPTTIIAFMIVLAFGTYSWSLILTALGFWLIALCADVLRNKEVNRLLAIEVAK